MDGEMNGGMDKEMTLPIGKGQYPEIEGLKNGDKVNFDGQGTIVEGEGGVSVQIDQMDVQPEDTAGRELKNMTKQDQNPNPSSNEDFKSKGF